MMKSTVQAPLEDRLAFFRSLSASISFQQAIDAVQYLRANKLTPNHPIHDPLVVALVVLYARPFKQRPPIRISAEMLPAEDRGFHDFLITCRDKILAHTDLDGPTLQDDHVINEIAGRTKNGLTIFGGTVVVPDLSKAIAHLQLARKLVDAEAEAVWKKYFRKERLQDGVTVINLEPGLAPFLLPHPMTKYGGPPRMAFTAPIIGYSDPAPS